jgi:hypothetical protein
VLRSQKAIRNDISLSPPPISHGMTLALTLMI